MKKLEPVSVMVDGKITGIFSTPDKEYKWMKKHHPESSYQTHPISLWFETDMEEL